MRRLFPWLILVLVLGCARDEPPRDVPPDTTGDRPEAVAAPQEPDGAVRGPRVVFLGTSLTAGLGLLRREEVYIERLAEMADSAGVPMQVVNAGVSGDTSAGGLRRLDWLLREHVDVLVVELGANDGLRGQDPEATARNLTGIIEATRARYPDAEILLAAMEAPPNLGEDYTRRFRSTFAEVSRTTGVALIPFLLDGVAGVPELNQDDGIHPTPEGHRRMARNVWPHLEPAVRAWWREQQAGEAGP